MTSLEIDDFNPNMFLEQVASLPEGVRENVLALQGLQSEYHEVFVAYFNERLKVEKKYEDLAAPLYAKRKEIVTGEREPTEEETKKGEALAEQQQAEESKVEEVKDEDDDEEEEKEEVEPMVDGKGVPNFWLTAMRNDPELQSLIKEKDEAVLERLADISCKTFDDFSGFELKFEFEGNDYFTESTLVKQYFVEMDEDDGETILKKAEGCKISWKEGMNVTTKQTKKKQQSKSGKGTRTVNKTVEVPSFFGFFSPPYAEDKDMTEHIADQMQQDFSYGCIIKERLIPRAVAWYTGEAAHSYLALNNDIQDDDSASDDAAGAGGAGGEQQDCKQQ